jgi:hypothetical protein
MNYKQLQSGYFEIKEFASPVGITYGPEVIDIGVPLYERKIAYHRERKLFGPYHPDDMSPIYEKPESIPSGPTGPVGSTGPCEPADNPSVTIHLDEGNDPFNTKKMLAEWYKSQIPEFDISGLLKEHQRGIKSKIEFGMNTMPNLIPKYTPTPFKDADDLDLNIRVTRITVKDLGVFTLDDIKKTVSLIEETSRSFIKQLNSDFDVLISYNQYGIGHKKEGDMYKIKSYMVIYILYHSESSFGYDINWLRRKDVAIPLTEAMKRDKDRDILSIQTLPGSVINNIMKFV